MFRLAFDNIGLFMNKNKSFHEYFLCFKADCHTCMLLEPCSGLIYKALYDFHGIAVNPCTMLVVNLDIKPDSLH